MEVMPVPTRNFMAKFDRYEPIVRDHTAIITAKTCYRKYFFKIVLGFRKKDNPPYIQFGQAYHTFREELEKLQDLEAALEKAADVWKKGSGDPPVGSDFDWLTGERLIKSCLVAHDFWQREKKLGRIVVVASEQEFIVTLKDGKTKTGGRADQLVRWNGRIWGRDFKATSKNAAWYQRMIEPNDQVTRYTLCESKMSGEEVQGQLIELLFNSRKEGPKIIPLTSTRTPKQLSEWEDDQIFFEALLEQCRQADKWPMCEHHCPYCEYHSVCKQINEGAMMNQLTTNFVQRQWDFTRTIKEAVD